MIAWQLKIFGHALLDRFSNIPCTNLMLTGFRFFYLFLTQREKYFIATKCVYSRNIYYRIYEARLVLVLCEYGLFSAKISDVGNFK